MNNTDNVATIAGLGDVFKSIVSYALGFAGIVLLVLLLVVPLFPPR